MAALRLFRLNFLVLPCHNTVLLLSFGSRTKTGLVTVQGKKSRFGLKVSGLVGDGPTSCDKNTIVPVFVVTKTDILSA